jgi:hypothetical protein
LFPIRRIQIIASLTDKELENIAKLAEDLLHYTDGKVRPTLGLYMRLAFIVSFPYFLIALPL